MTANLVRNRDDVLTVMRKARETLGFTHLEMDERVGLGSGHYGKIERMGAGWGKEALKLSPSIVNCLDLLGLEIVIAPKGEIPAQTVARDVRLPPPSNVVQLPRPAMSGPPGLVRQWVNQRLAERVAKGQKKGRRASRTAAQVGGATC